MQTRSVAVGEVRLTVLDSCDSVQEDRALAAVRLTALLPVGVDVPVQLVRRAPGPEGDEKKGQEQMSRHARLKVSNSIGRTTIYRMAAFRTCQRHLRLCRSAVNCRGGGPHGRYSPFGLRSMGGEGRGSSAPWEVARSPERVDFTCRRTRID